MLLFIHLILFILTSSVQSGNIFAIFMHPAPSHQRLFQNIYRDLSLRHNVTVITSHPLNDSSLVNLTEINVDFIYHYYLNTFLQKPSFLTEIDRTKNIYSGCDAFIELLFESEMVARYIFDRNAQYDVVLTHGVHPIWIMLGKLFQAPVIEMFPSTPWNIGVELYGTPNHPVLYPDNIVFDYPDGNLNLWQKINSIYYAIWHHYYYYNVIIPKADQTLKKYFGDSLPPLIDIQRNVSMFLIYRNVYLNVFRSNAPSVVDFAPIQLRKDTQLPKNLEEILNSATHGIIYVSFGSNILFTRLHPELQQTIISALAELPYTVLLKYEDDVFINKARNIVIQKWFPQAAILAHPNVKLFVSQGGQHSLQEAIYYKVPVIGIPFYLDQFHNLRKMSQMGCGETVETKVLTKDILKNTIIRVAAQKMYKDNIMKLNEKMFDQSIKGIDRVSWCIDYVIRHKGAPHLKTPRSLDFVYLFLWETVILSVICIMCIYGSLIFYRLLKKLLNHYTLST